MTAAGADRALLLSMRRLALDMGMLTGLTVAFGTGKESASFSVGLKREVRRAGGVFTGAPEPIDGDTVYDLASLTKLFTLVGVLQLMERGRLRPGDTLGGLDARFAGLSDCTVLDCLTYQAALQTPERIDAQPDAGSAERMVFMTRRVKAEGMKRYSDMNALLLKYALEAASGRAFFDYLSEYVLKPLGMGETWHRVPAARHHDLMDYALEHRVENGAYRVMEGPPPGLPHDPKARLLTGKGLPGHAGLFSTCGDMCKMAKGLLSGALLPPGRLFEIGVNRTGVLAVGGEYRQFLGMLCFAKSPVARLSEVPPWMGLRAFAFPGYTGNHLAMDPDNGVFDLFLGNRCHNRVSRIEPEEAAEALGLPDSGEGRVRWPDGRLVRSSFRYVYQKDRMLHAPVRDCLLARGWAEEAALFPF